MPDEQNLPAAPKKPWESKTIIINAFLGVLMALLPFIPYLQPLVDWVNGNGILIGTIWAALAVALRFISKGAIQLGD